MRGSRQYATEKQDFPKKLLRPKQGTGLSLRRLTDLRHGLPGRMKITLTFERSWDEALWKTQSIHPRDMPAILLTREPDPATRKPKLICAIAPAGRTCASNDREAQTQQAARAATKETPCMKFNMMW